MKFFLIGALLLSVSSVTAQTKGDRKITVSVTDTADLFNRVSLYLYEHGYSADQKDQAVQFIETAPRRLTRWNAYQKIRVLVKGSEVVITSTVTVDKDSGDVQFRGGKGSIFRDCWDNMEALAAAFPGQTSYSK